MTRIPLTDEDIVHVEDELIIQCGFDEIEAEQLKKQILDDYEFREKYQESAEALMCEPPYVTTLEDYKELKEKAEKWDNIESQEPYGSALDTLNSQVIKLEQENKQLKAKMKFTIKEDGSFDVERLDEESIRNREIVQKLTGVIDELERTDYGYWTLEMLYEKLREFLKEKHD